MSDKLYCPECGEYLMGADGECHDCHCGWKQYKPTEPTEPTEQQAIDKINESDGK